jgi:hypothetical protein
MLLFADALNDLVEAQWAQGVSPEAMVETLGVHLANALAVHIVTAQLSRQQARAQVERVCDLLRMTTHAFVPEVRARASRHEP